ncbi:MAG: hypothetical protein HRT89_00980 [Lentisphaeria bacterium]|nr:hypothetical protein [Lentisphaeria bacterium]NQZ66617.1 hypothetical protein [Lentisphaeria bacterium]
MKNLTISLFLLLITQYCFANVTTPFDQAMLSADKIILAKVISKTKATVNVEIVELFKGTHDKKTIVVKMDKQVYYLKSLIIDELCYMLLNKNNAMYATNYACGEHSLLILKDNKLTQGTYRFRFGKQSTMNKISSNIRDVMKEMSRIEIAIMQIRKDNPKAVIKEMRPSRHLNLSRTAISDISALKGIPLTHLGLTDTQVNNISVLNGMPLSSLGFSNTKVDDISSLKRMPMAYLYFSGTKVTDISALKGMPLRTLYLPITATKIEFLKSVKTLTWINSMSSAKFWASYGKTGIIPIVLTD